MTISELLLPEFDQEMANTRKLLERYPEGKADWKPHEKSMPLGRLAGHIAELPTWAANTIQQESLELNQDSPAVRNRFIAGSREELLERFDKNVAEARAAIAGATDEGLAKIWTLRFGGQTVLSMPRRSVLRSVVMNHLIHHRAQLGVYLRLNSIAIPGLYGPSADESPIFTRQQGA
jgi:uncharacterized damage-inducible protein DinB